MANPSTRIGASKTIALYEKQQGKCFYCGKKLWDGIKADFTVDHKNPSSRGGKKEIDNLCLACQYCNSLKGSLTDREFKVALDLMKQGKINRKKIISYGQYLLAKMRYEVKKI